MPVSQDTGIYLMRYIQGENRSQTALFPVSLDELTPDDHLVRVIEAYVSLLDFEQLGFDKARPRLPDALRTILPICSNSISTVTSSVFAPRDDSKPSVSAMLKSCGCWVDWPLISKPSLTFDAITVPRSPRRAAPSFGLPKYRADRW